MKRNIELPHLDLKNITAAANRCEEYSIEMMRLKQTLEEMTFNIEHHDNLVAREMRARDEMHDRIIMRIFDIIDEVRNHPDAQTGTLQYFHARLLDVIMREGIEPFMGTAGKQPDPEIHEVVGTAYEPVIQQGVIISTMKSGYGLHGKIIRRSGVIINDRPEEVQQ
jgi:molecular chaperone GrpE (heat shock protein)